MADELSVSGVFSFTKGNIATFGRGVVADLITVAGSRFHHNIQSIGFAAEEALGLGDLTAPFGWFWAQNLDNTNFVEIRSATGAGNDIVKLLAGEFCLFRLGSDIAAPYALADTAAVNLEYVIFPP